MASVSASPLLYRILNCYYNTIASKHQKIGFDFFYVKLSVAALGFDALSESRVRFSVYIPEELHTRFKLSTTARGVSMNSVIIDAMEQWLEKNPPPEPQTKKPKTITQLIQVNYFALLKDGKLKPERLQVIAEGEEPTRNELYIISSVIKVPQKELVELHKKTYGSIPLSNGEREIEKKRKKKPNGAANGTT